jgi:hypothetical protein
MITLESYINEKLSLGDKFIKISNKWLFGIDSPSQDEYVKRIKSFVKTQSGGNCSIMIKRTRELVRDIDNVLNADLSSVYNTCVADDGKPTLKQALKTKMWYNDMEISDETPFVCYYMKGKKGYFVDVYSPFFMSVKLPDGTRPLKNRFSLDVNNVCSLGYEIVNEIIPFLSDPDEGMRKIMDANDKSNLGRKKSIEQKIKDLEDEIENLKRRL